jgi:hypothetical protein
VDNQIHFEMVHHVFRHGIRSTNHHFRNVLIKQSR